MRIYLKVVVVSDIPDNVRQLESLWKAGPILRGVRQDWLKLERQKNIAIDEEMAPFAGTCSLKPWVKRKPELRD